MFSLVYEPQKRLYIYRGRFLQSPRRDKLPLNPTHWTHSRSYCLFLELLTTSYFDNPYFSGAWLLIFILNTQYVFFMYWSLKQHKQNRIKGIVVFDVKQPPIKVHPSCLRNVH